MIPMSREEHARFRRAANVVLGAAFIATIALAPLGVWLIGRGLRGYRRALSERSDGAGPVDEARALGLALSWDDTASPSEADSE